MGKAKMLGLNKPLPHNTRQGKAPWQGAKKKYKKEDNPVKLLFCDEIETDPEREKQRGEKTIIPPRENTCVCCGEIIPEGRQVCPRCEREKGLTRE